MPEMLATIAKRLEVIELIICLSPNLMRRKMFGSMFMDFGIISQATLQNKQSMGGRVPTLFPSTSKAKASPFSNQKLTSGYAKGRRSLCWICSMRPKSL